MQFFLLHKLQGGKWKPRKFHNLSYISYAITFTVIFFPKQPFHSPIRHDTLVSFTFQAIFLSFKSEIDLILNEFETSWVQSQSN